MRLAEDLLCLSRQRNDSAGLRMGQQSAGRTLMIAGRFGPSRSHLEAWLALDQQIGRLSDRALHAFLGIVLFCLGFPDQALAHSNAVIAAARKLNDPTSFVSTLSIGIRLLLFLGDDAAMEEWARQLVAVATEQGFPHWRGEGTVCLGWVKVKKGDVAEGISLLRSGCAAYRANGARVFMPHNIALLAEACEIAGQRQEAWTLLDQALQTVDTTGERWFLAELNRLKGRLLLRQGHAETAEELYCKALGIAQEQEAKLWELRAVVSIARLRRDQGRRAEAHDLLAPVYGWLTEGFGTSDLKEPRHCSTN